MFLVLFAKTDPKRLENPTVYGHFQFLYHAVFQNCDGIELKKHLYCLRPYHVENTGSRPISEVKQRRAWLVLRWVTTWEPQVLLAFAIFERFSQKNFYAAFRFMSLWLILAPKTVV